MIPLFVFNSASHPGRKLSNVAQFSWAAGRTESHGKEPEFYQEGNTSSDKSAGWCKDKIRPLGDWESWKQDGKWHEEQVRVNDSGLWLSPAGDCQITPLSWCQNTLCQLKAVAHSWTPVSYPWPSLLPIASPLISSESALPPGLFCWANGITIYLRIILGITCVTSLILINCQIRKLLPSWLHPQFCLGSSPHHLFEGPLMQLTQQKAPGWSSCLKCSPPFLPLSSAC